MSRFEALLRKYREQTACDPTDSIESTVLARLRMKSGDSGQARLAKPSIRWAAIGAGLAIGLLAAALPPFAANAERPMPELAVFAPDAQHPPLIWLDAAR
jgi:hypothetical protein